MAKAENVKNLLNITTQENAENVPKGVFNSIFQDNTEEIVIGFVGPIKSGVSTIARKLAEILENKFEYDVKFHKISTLIQNNAKNVNINLPKTLKGIQRLNEYQKTGDQLREKFKGSKSGDLFNYSYLAEKVVQDIFNDREKAEGPILGTANDFGKENIQLKKTSVKPRRVAHIIDSLKHPDEVELLKLVYKDMFWLVGVQASMEIRKDRLIGAGILPENSKTEDHEVEKILLKDEKSNDDCGQMVAKTIQLSDFFIKGDHNQTTVKEKVIHRFLDLLFNTKIVTPTLEEMGMHNASSASGGSACLSKQVGASIYTEKGELLAVGANDVPKSGGGQYLANSKKDFRCFKWGGFCWNDKKKNQLYEEISKILINENLIAKDVKKEKLVEVISNTKVKNLIEFSRSIHAEMSAILSVAREGKAGMVGGTLFSTTYPCHNCGRHIIAAGISDVVYIEPYPKSLANELHGDSILPRSLELPNELPSLEKPVKFRQYEGVAPRNYLNLFKNSIERKQENGEMVDIEPKIAHPLRKTPLNRFSDYEMLVLEHLTKLEEDTMN